MRGCPESQWAYAYPPRSAAWKKRRQVVQTAADPPNQGSICFAIMGCTTNSRNAPVRMVAPKRTTERRGTALSGDDEFGNCHHTGPFQRAITAIASSS